MRYFSKAMCIVSAALCLNISAYSQDISLIMSNVTVKEAIEELKRTSGYLFVFSSRDVDTKQRISISAKDATIEEVIKQILKGQINLSYEIQGKRIIISKATQGTVKNASEKKKITGKVVDVKGEPIIGATIKEKGTSNGTVTDFDGNFTLDASPGAVLEISYIGFQSQQLKAVSGTLLSVTLKEDTEILEEVVVVGYGTQKKVNLTGSVTSVDTERLENRPVGNIAEGLQGTMPGVVVSRSSGELGKNPTIRIRGFSSLNSGGALVIIDGVPGDMNNISPNDIENISVLKDAASSSIYGARAAEGVILITTKKGNDSDRVKIQYSSNFSFQTPTILPEPNSAYDGAIYANQAFTNAGGSPLYPEWMLEKFKDSEVTAVPYENGSDYYYVADFNWWEYFLDKSFQQTQNLSLSGGSKKHKYMLSGSWLDQNGYFSKWGPDNYDRITIRTNMTNHIISDKLILDTNLSLANIDRDASSSETSFMMQSIRDAGNSLPLYNPDGTYARYRMQQNTMQLLKEAGFRNKNTNRFEGRAMLTWNVNNDLSFKALGGYNVEWSKSKLWQRAYYKYRPSGPSNLGYQNQPNKLTEGTDYAKYYIAQFQANYNKQFKSHFLGILAGTSVEESFGQTLSTYRSNIIGNELPSLGLGEAESARNTFTISDDWGLVSAFARINYNFSERYLFEANLRADGSSRFSDSNKWGIFPSFSLGWRVTEENFMKNQRVFSNLKLRASYGELGNQNGLGLYDHIPVYKVNKDLIPFPSGIQQQIASESLPSEDRTWETITSWNLGVEMGFLNNHLNVEAEVFRKLNKDMLINISLPSIIGIDVPTGNYGELLTKGWELSIRYNDVIKSIGLAYHIDFNIYDQTDELIDMATSFTTPTTGVQNIQGYPVNSIFAYVADGYFQSEEEVEDWAFQNANTSVGDIRYIDQNKDGKITNSDVVHVGSTTPRFCYGINAGLEWNNFDLTVFFQGVGKRTTYLNSAFSHPYQNAWDNYSFKDVMDYWTPENRDARFPRPHQGGHNYLYSTHWLQDASYIRLKNLQFGYNFPQKVISKLKLSALRFYVSGENLWENTSMMMFDPETDDSSTGIYPLNRSYSLGLSLTY